MTEADGPGTTTSELDAWVREELQLGVETSIEIGEKPGTDPRCSPIITEVLIGGPGEAQYAFHIERPLAELTRMDLIAALAFGGGH